MLLFCPNSKGEHLKEQVIESVIVTVPKSPDEQQYNPAHCQAQHLDRFLH